jgi:TonB family protein
MILPSERFRRKRAFALKIATCMFCLIISLSGQSTVTATPIPGVEILSNTHGVDFSPYLRNVLPQIRRDWLPLLPEEARPPVNMQGETVISFVIYSDGTVGRMNLEKSNHHINIDRAAWGAIKAVGQFPALPEEFKEPYIELRINFRVNFPAPVMPR